MKRPAVFFDRDNTLIVSDGYLGDPAKVVLVEGAANAIAKARQYGFKVLTFSNQSGVARGLFDEAAVQAVNARVDELLLAANPAAKIVAHEYCPDHPEATVERYRKDSPRRKPKPGMLLEASEEHNLDLSRSWVIGDAPRDIEAGHAAGCRTILFRDPKMAASPAADQPSEVPADFVVNSLKEAAELIGREAFKQTAGKAAKAATPAQGKDPHPGPVPEGEGEKGAVAEGEGEKAGDAGPHPSPLPEYRERGPDADYRERGAEAESREKEQDGHARAEVAEDDPELPDISTLPRWRGAAARAAGRGAGAADSAEGSGEAEALVPRGGSNTKVQQLLMQILLELKRQRSERGEFSIPKVLAGIAQVLSAALLVLALFSRHSASFQPTMLYAIALQVMTIALLVMGKQK